MSADFAALLGRRITPLTTYRLQLRGGFGFAEATALLDYLEALGVTDCYTSPILQARPGSPHAYDITDHNRLNGELGSSEDYARFAAALKSRRMGHLLDFVPNHMGLDQSNAWWQDVLENGESSPYAPFFDIDWAPAKTELRHKVLLPILGDQYGLVLERGELTLSYADGRFALAYGESRLPLDPRTFPAILRRGLEGLSGELGEDERLSELLSIARELDNLPPSWDARADRVAERRREKEVARQRLDALVKGSPRVETHVRDATAFFNGRAGEPRSFDALHALLEAQPYRLAYWKTASEEINYRRFFDINDLAGLHTESEEVFEATHGLVLELLAKGLVSGLRIDHPDGLYDPGRYFERLQSAFARAGRARACIPASR